LISNMCHKPSVSNQICFITLFLFLPILWLVGAKDADAAGGLDLQVKIQTGQFQPYKIAVGDFDVVGDYSAKADSLAQEVRQVIYDDLDFHIFFNVVKRDTFYLRVYEITDVTPKAWHLMGADYLVGGNVELDGDDIKVYYTISDLTQLPIRQIDLATEKLKTKAFNYRRVAHMIGDAVVEHITAEKGFFTTRIAYISSQTGHKELWMCDYDGKNPRRITNDRSLDLSPDWDRKDDKLVYTSYKSGRPEIWQVDISSGETKPISTYKGSSNAARISPNNKEILVSLTKDGNSELYVLDRNGKIKRRLTNLASIESSGSWSPTGNEIAFSSDRSGQPQVYLMDSEGFNVSRLTYERSYNDSPDFCPRGTAIAYVSRGGDGNFQICTIDHLGGHFQLLDQTGSNENPRWSPDGWHLVFAKRTGDDWNLYIMDMFKQHLRQITFDGKSSNPAWQPFPDNNLEAR